MNHALLKQGCVFRILSKTVCMWPTGLRFETPELWRQVRCFKKTKAKSAQIDAADFSVGKNIKYLMGFETNPDKHF